MSADAGVMPLALPLVILPGQVIPQSNKKVSWVEIFAVLFKRDLAINL